MFRLCVVCSSTEMLYLVDITHITNQQSTSPSIIIILSAFLDLLILLIKIGKALVFELGFTIP